MPIICSRPPKLNDADTILYEIYLLRFAAKRLVREHWEEPQDAWVYLESFLLHFRNLIEFLGKHKNFRDGDLLVRELWKSLDASPPDKLDEIHDEGQKLLAEYEEVEDRISRYLQHCTTKRTVAKDWFIDEMSNKIEPLLARIIPSLRSKSENPFLPPVERVNFPKPHSASTLVCTSTSGAAAYIGPLKSAEEIE